MAVGWKQYQEEAAEFFRSIGFSAVTDVTLQGVRTKHDIDVVVTTDVAGFNVRWLVECKHWKDAVNKLHIFALREIVADLGADRGIILCEVGFQSGAIEAANLTNVQITSLAALSISSRESFYAVRLRELYDRTDRCRARYWDIPKDIRIEKGLRSEMFDENMYSGARVVESSSEILARAFRASYPIEIDHVQRLYNPGLPERLGCHEDVVAALEPMILDLEARLDAIEVGDSKVI